MYKTKVTINPTNHFEINLHKYLINRGAQRIINQFYAATARCVPYQTVLEENYSPIYWDTSQVTLHSNGVYKYPGDHEQHPMFVCENDTESLYFYEFDVIVVRDAEGFYMTRVD